MEESHSGYCTSFENWNPSRGSWVRVPPPPQSTFFIEDRDASEIAQKGSFLL